MKSEKTAKDLAAFVEGKMGIDWPHGRVEEIAAFLGVELAPERPPAEERPEWWGQRLFADAAGNVLTHDFDAVVLCTGPTGLANRRALVAAYEAARLAGVLPGLRAPGAVAAIRWFGKEQLKVSGDGLVWTAGGEPAELVELNRLGEGVANRELLVEGYNRFVRMRRELEFEATRPDKGPGLLGRLLVIARGEDQQPDEPRLRHRPAGTENLAEMIESDRAREVAGHDPRFGLTTEAFDQSRKS